LAKKVINPKQKETTLHSLLSKYANRTNDKREFFQISIQEIKIFFDLIDGDLLINDKEEIEIKEELKEEVKSKTETKQKLKDKAKELQERAEKVAKKRTERRNRTKKELEQEELKQKELKQEELKKEVKEKEKVKQQIEVKEIEKVKQQIEVKNNRIKNFNNSYGMIYLILLIINLFLVVIYNLKTLPSNS
jgi:cobalamin biosynthesis Mg chelatase CobN